MKMKLVRIFMEKFKTIFLLVLILQYTLGRRSHGYENIRPFHKRIFGDLVISQINNDFINSCKYLCVPLEDKHWNCEAKFPFFTKPDCKLCQMNPNINFGTANDEAMRLWRESLQKFKNENESNWENHISSFCNICIVPRKEKGGTCIPGNELLQALDSSSYCNYFCKSTPSSQTSTCHFHDRSGSEQCQECSPNGLRDREEKFQVLISKKDVINKENSVENFCKKCFHRSDNNKCELAVPERRNPSTPQTSPNTQPRPNTHTKPRTKPVLNCENSCEVKKSTSLLCKLSSNLKICHRCDLKWDTDFENCFDCTKCFGNGNSCQALKLISSSIFNSFEPDMDCSKYCQKGSGKAQNCSFKKPQVEQDQNEYKIESCIKCSVITKENEDNDKLNFEFFTSYPGLFEGVNIPEYQPNFSISDYIAKNQIFNQKAKEIINNFCGKCGYSNSNLSCKWDYSQAKKKRRVK
jgi:hypothetical protein